MISLVTSTKAQKKVAQNMKALRLQKELTQVGLSNRAGVSVSSLRKFERTGVVSLESFFKLAMTLGCLEKLVKATEPSENNFSSIDEVLSAKDNKKPKRGWRK